MLYRPGLVGRLPCPMDWYPGSGPPTIDDGFASSMPAGWTFARASANATNCTWQDGSTTTTFTTYAADTPRFLAFGLLMEPQRTNLFLNSDAPVSQGIVVTAGTTYTLWMLGAGSVMIAGAAGPTGTATHGAPFTFTATSTNAQTLTVTAPVTRVQLEAGPAPTSYIPSGATAQTRAEDRLSRNYFGGELNVNQGTYWIEYLKQGPLSSVAEVVMTAGVNSYSSNANTDQIITAQVGGNNAAQGQIYGSGLAGSDTVNLPKPIGGVSRVAMSVSQHKMMIATDYTLADAPVDPSFRPASLVGVTLGGGGLGRALNGFIRGFKYWPIAMPDAELKECTGAGYYRGAPVVDTDFKQGTMPRRFTFTRSGLTGSAVPTSSIWTDAPGSTFTSFAVTAPRLVASGLVLEQTRANFIANPAAPPVSGNSGNVTNQQYCLWMIGTGSVTVAPGTTGAGGVGFGTATQGNPVWFTPAATGTVALTITGSVNRAQIEQQGAISYRMPPTSFINNTLQNAARGNEYAVMRDTGWFPRDQCTYYVEFTPMSYQQSGSLLGIGALSNDREGVFTQVSVNNPLPAYQVRNILLPSGGNLGPCDTAQDVTFNTLHKIAYSSGQYNRVVAMNGVLGGSQSLGLPRLNSPADFILGGSPAGGGGVTGAPMPCILGRLRIYDYAMTPDEIVALTT